MVLLPDFGDPVAAAIFAVYAKREEDWRRPHLGASAIGDQVCQRAVWMSFRWCTPPRTPNKMERGQLLRLFERGRREERWILDDLRDIGATVDAIDTNTESQRRGRPKITGAGHVSGSVDALVLGLPGAPKTWHVVDVKTANAKKFEELLKKGVLEAMPGYYAQQQLYMRWLGLERACLIVVCKDDDRIHAPRLHHDPAYSAATELRAVALTLEHTAPSKISVEPDYFECKACSHYGPCQLGRLEELQRNCRTCVSATPRGDGTWWCELLGKPLATEDQRAGCEKHLMLPDLVQLEPVAVDEHERAILYAAGGRLELVDERREFKFRERQLRAVK